MQTPAQDALRTHFAEGAKLHLGDKPSWNMRALLGVALVAGSLMAPVLANPAHAEGAHLNTAQVTAGVLDISSDPAQTDQTLRYYLEKIQAIPVPRETKQYEQGETRPAEKSAFGAADSALNTALDKIASTADRPTKIRMRAARVVMGDKTSSFEAIRNSEIFLKDVLTTNNFSDLVQDVKPPFPYPAPKHITGPTDRRLPSRGGHTIG